MSDIREILVLAILFFALTARPAAQTPVVPPAIPAEQERRLATLPADTQADERFRYWLGLQPREVRDDWKRYYDRYLVQIGVARDERLRLIRVIESQGKPLEVDRWNRILTADKPSFNTNPNAFLVEAIKGRRDCLRKSEEAAR